MTFFSYPFNSHPLTTSLAPQPLVEAKSSSTETPYSQNRTKPMPHDFVMQNKDDQLVKDQQCPGHPVTPCRICAEL